MNDAILLAAPLLIGAIILTVRFVGCSFSAGVVPNYSQLIITTPGVVSFWRLNEQTGTTANDTEDGNLGTYEGGVTLGGSPLANTDVHNFAATFDGSTGFVDVPFAPNINPAQFTVEALVNPSAIGDGSGTDFHALVSSRVVVASNTFGYILYLHGSDFEAWVGNGTPDFAKVIVPADATAGGGPYYVAMTYDGTNLTLYVNPTDAFDSANPSATEQQQASMAVSYMPNTESDLGIGAATFPTPPRFFFPGVICDVAVYDTALDFSTIQVHFLEMMAG